MPAPASLSSPQFHDGYYSGAGYTYKAYPEYFPLRLSLIALLAGQRPLRLDQPFRLVDFGCGQGVGLCIQAALHPHASFTGIDVLATHISHGRQLAEAAGLANVHFQDADLSTLAGQPSPSPSPTSTTTSSTTKTPLPSPADRATPGGHQAPAPGSVDLAVCHGVLSWVSREVQQAIWQLTSSCLRPGGLLAISYNAFPGNLSTVPFQHLVRALQDAHAAGTASLEAAMALSMRLQQCGAGLFQAQPSLAAQLQELPNRDPDYLPHEYNQKHWQPRFSDAVIRQASGHGFSFLASASLPDSFEGLLPPAFRDLLADQQDPALRQLLHDLLTNASFRRDVYARGLDQLWPLDTQQALGELQILRLISDEQLERADPEELFRFSLSFGGIQGNPDWFGTFLRELGSEPRRLADLSGLGGIAALPLPELLPNLALLQEKGLVEQLAPPVDHGPSQRLNRVLAARIRAGGPYRSLAAPRIGSCVQISDLDGLALAAHGDGLQVGELVGAIDANLRDLGRELQRDGVVLSGDDRTSFLRQQVSRFERRTLPRLQRLGAVA